MTDSPRLRVAVAGVSHYHAAYYPVYLDLLKQHGADLVAVADSNAGIAQDRALRFGGTPYADFRQMVETERPDFVLGLGRHFEMPEICRYLIESGARCLMEKPWGTDAATVRELAGLAESCNAWIATPFAFRYTQWAETARELKLRGTLGTISHLRFRMIRPGVQRYREQDESWMLSRREAGGGVLLNLGVHGFDIIRHLTGEEPEIVSASLSNAVFGLDVEDYASVTLRTPSGVIGQVEVGYTFPAASGDDDECVLATESLLLRETTNGCSLTRLGGLTLLPQVHNNALLWSGVIADCLERVRAGGPPPTSPRDTERAVSLVFEAYERVGGLPDVL